MIPELADLVGYSARDAFKRTKVHTAVGVEEGRCARENDTALSARGGDIDAVAVEGEVYAAGSVLGR